MDFHPRVHVLRVGLLPPLSSKLGGGFAASENEAAGSSVRKESLPLATPFPAKV